MTNADPDFFAHVPSLCEERQFPSPKRAHDEFLVVGIESRQGRPLRALLARDAQWGLEYAGTADLVLTDAEVRQLRKLMDELRCDYPHVKIRSRDARWLRPCLRAVAIHQSPKDAVRPARLTVTIEVSGALRSTEASGKNS